MASFDGLKAASIRDTLRVQTRVAHDRLHRHSSFVSLFDATLSLDDYRQLIQRKFGFYAALDDAIERVILQQHDPAAGYTYARRSDFLAQDLMDLGASDLAVRESPQCVQAYDLVTPASLGGVLYVIEGATLGGAGIDRAVHKLLGKDEPDGRRYWAWCRSENKTRWSMTLGYLEHLAAKGASVEDLASGARGTFQLLADWLAPLDQVHSALESEHS